MSSEMLASYAAVLLSLVFSYIPSADGWWGQLSGTGKRLIMLGLLAVIAIATVVIACAGFAADLGLDVVCDRAGFVAVLRAFLAAVIANQAVYSISPKTAAKS